MSKRVFLASSYFPRDFELGVLESSVLNKFSLPTRVGVEVNQLHIGIVFKYESLVPP